MKNHIESFHLLSIRSQYSFHFFCSRFLFFNQSFSIRTKYWWLSNIKTQLKVVTKDSKTGMNEVKEEEKKWTNVFFFYFNAHQIISYLLSSHWFVEFIWSSFLSRMVYSLCSYFHFHFLCWLEVLIYTSTCTIIKHNEETSSVIKKRAVHFVLNNAPNYEGRGEKSSASCDMHCT